MRTLSVAEELKFHLLACGMSISPAAATALRQSLGERPLTPADYASTSGLILRLDEDVWVNAPIAEHNPNFVEAPPLVLDWTDGGLVVSSEKRSSSAWFCPPPAYHGSVNDQGTPRNNYVYTHGDRVRLAPVHGCVMTCTFCNVPYESRYATKPIEEMIEALACAIADPLQPARHILISGGTPAPRDVPYLQQVYKHVLSEFAGMDIDIMMVPIDGLLDVQALKNWGVHELSINLELGGRDRAASLMPQKYRHGLDHYLDFLAESARILGRGRVRSMLMVGLEPAEDTLAGVQAILERGCVPVLSPFRPDPNTPLHDSPPPGPEELIEVFMQADELATAAGMSLGPTCLPCTHNTLTLASRLPAGASIGHPLPHLLP